MYEAHLLSKKGDLVLYVEVKTNICCSFSFCNLDVSSC
jgi:hypothetical protein